MRIIFNLLLNDIPTYYFYFTIIFEYSANILRQHFFLLILLQLSHEYFIQVLYGFKTNLYNLIISYTHDMCEYIINSK